jgi:hypothetical protein
MLNSVQSKVWIIVVFCFMKGTTLKGQQSVYDNFENRKHVCYLERGGVLDTTIKNPSQNSLNSSAKCALYVRNGSRKFDNIKMSLNSGLMDIDKYATYEGNPPHIKLKIYTTAPAGTLVEVLLGSRNGNNDYPAGTHSQYQAYTKKSNEWEELEFLFSQIPQGSETSAAQVDQIVLLFNPNSSTSDTYYFDDLTGPLLSNETKTGPSTDPANKIPEAAESTRPEATPTGTKNASSGKIKKSKK